MMRGKSSRSKKSGKPRGFTFTISIILLSLTLIAVALFSQEWRRMQKVSYNEVMPSETARLQERISSDFAVMFGTDASVKKQGASSVRVEVKDQMPYKKEGAPLADVEGYSSSLPSNLRDKGYEAVVAANNMAGSTATVITLSDSGSLQHTNDGVNDVATFFHPMGWVPKTIEVAITCAKAASAVSELAIQGSGSETNEAISYYITYIENAAGGKTYTRSAIAPLISTATLSAFYPDGTQLMFNSQFLPFFNASNYTSLTYTKSPGGELILPFDADDGGGATRDYSSSMHAFYPTGDSRPVWQPSCKFGGCYSFDGSQSYISGPIALTETELTFPPSGQLMSNRGFEVYQDGNSGEGAFGTYSWPGWTVQNNQPEVSFEPSTDTPLSQYALRIANSGDGEGKDSIEQEVQVQENTRYILEFYSKGGYRYEIYTNVGKVSYLQADGGWGGEHAFEAQSGTDSYSKVTREFALPLGASSVNVKLLAPSSSDPAYYDSFSLVQSVGLNGGFEYYYKDNSILPSD